MSDKVYALCLPRRRWSSMQPEPHYNGCQHLGSVHMSGIATQATLKFWQDTISKQVFWADGGIGGYGAENLEFCGKDGMTQIKQWGFWTLSPSRFPQIANFIMGWGAMWGTSYLQDKRNLIKAVQKALEASPTDKQIYDYWCFINYSEKTDFMPWWTE